jgi:hypothetical protein
MNPKHPPSSAEAAVFVMALEKPIADLLREYSVAELRARTSAFLKRLQLVKKK